MINFLTAEAAVQGFGHAQAEYGGHFATRPKTIGYFSEVRARAKNSPTARAILKAVEESDRVINFIGMYGGFQCFDESADNHSTKKKEPTIYVDLHGRLSVYVRGPHEQATSRADAVNPNMQAFNNKIALLHELGHAKQFIENPTWYAFYASSQKKAEWRDSIEAKAKGLWTAKFTPRVVVKNSGGPPPPPAFGAARPNPAAQVNAFIGKATDRAKPQKWFVVIDVDNMQRHEWPICREMGLPVRLNYTDLNVG
jgi:hypothetical protein